MKLIDNPRTFAPDCSLYAEDNFKGGKLVKTYYYAGISRFGCSSVRDLALEISYKVGQAEQKGKTISTFGRDVEGSKDSHILLNGDEVLVVRNLNEEELMGLAKEVSKIKTKK